MENFVNAIGNRIFENTIMVRLITCKCGANINIRKTLTCKIDHAMANVIATPETY